MPNPIRTHPKLFERGFRLMAGFLFFFTFIMTLGGLAEEHPGMLLLAMMSAGAWLFLSLQANRLERRVILHVFLALLAGHFVKGRLRNVEVPTLYQLWHVPTEKRQ